MFAGILIGAVLGVVIGLVIGALLGYATRRSAVKDQEAAAQAEAGAVEHDP